MPHLGLQLVLVPAAFVMAIVWLNVMANEIVSVMRAFGLLLNIDTGEPMLSSVVLIYFVCSHCCHLLFFVVVIFIRSSD